MVAEKRVVVVLGMHHSGTSVIARSLMVFNVYLGDDLMPSQPDHPTGFWEDNQITATNDRILVAHGFSWRKPGFDCARLKKHSTYQQTIRHIAQHVHRRFAHAPLWGFKDPRTCRLIPLWKDVFRLLKVQASYIIVVRHPRSVAESLRAKYRMSLRLGYQLWLEHMAAAVTETRQHRRVFVSYDRMLNDPKRELRREAEALQLDTSQLKTEPARSFIQSFLDTQLRHRLYGYDDVLPSATDTGVHMRAYALLDAMAADEISATAFHRAWKKLCG